MIYFIYVPLGIAIAELNYWLVANEQQLKLQLRVCMCACTQVSCACVCVCVSHGSHSSSMTIAKRERTYVACPIWRHVQQAVPVLYSMPDISMCCYRHPVLDSVFRGDSQSHDVPLLHRRPCVWARCHWTRSLWALAVLQINETHRE